MGTMGQIGTISAGVVQELLRGYYATLELDPRFHSDNSVHPGEPLHVRWSTQPFLGSEVSVGNFTATISLDGHPVFGPTDLRSGVLRPEDLGTGFYRAGTTQTLLLALTPENATTTTASVSLAINIVPDQVEWLWSHAIPGVRWKQDSYTLGGSVRFSGEFTSVSGSVVLNETSDTPAAVLPHIYGPVSVMVPHRGSTDVAFPPITQAWPWFDRILLITTTEVGINFSYQASFTLTDGYGNAFAGDSDTPQSVNVSVDLAKTLELMTAFTLQISAVIMTGAAAIAWVAAPVLIGIAAGLEAAAQIAAAAALDPPEPDPRYLESVPRQPVSLGKAVLEGGQLGAAYADWLVPVLRILGSLDVVSQIQGRLMGARNDRSLSGIQLQRGDYVRILAQMTADAQLLPGALAGVQAAIKENPVLTSNEVGKGLEAWSDTTVRNKLYALWAAEGHPNEHLDLISKAMVGALEAKQSPHLDTLMADLMAALHGIVAETAKSASRFMGGY